MSARSENILKSVIDSSIREGQSHLKHIHRASSILSDYFPLTEEQLNSFPDDIVPVLDQFIYRFTKLQDSMAGRLLPALDSLLRADDSPRPFLDVLSYLEQVGALPSENEWQCPRLPGIRRTDSCDAEYAV